MHFALLTLPLSFPDVFSHRLSFTNTAFVCSCIPVLDVLCVVFVDHAKWNIFRATPCSKLVCNYLLAGTTVFENQKSVSLGCVVDAFIEIESLCSHGAVGTTARD